MQVLCPGLITCIPPALLYYGHMTDTRIASTIYWKTEKERIEAHQKADDADESLSSFVRKLVKKSKPAK